MFIEVLIAGIMVGAIYTLITIGYSMVYGILKLMNFAHGDVYIFGTFICYTLLAKYNVNLFLSIIAAAIVGGLLAALVEFLAYRRLRASQHRLISMITALGAAYIISNTSELTWGNRIILFPSIVQSETTTVLGYQISVTQIITLIVAVIIIVAFNLFLKYHKMGKAILCVSEDLSTSSLMGIPINRTISIVYFLGGVLGVIGGILYSSSYNAIWIGMGFRGTVIAFTAAVIGGIGSLSGALLGGMIIGILENITNVYISSAFRDPIIFAVLILILLFRPSGILLKDEQSKV